MRRSFDTAVTFVQYLIALFMMLAGALTATGPISPHRGRLGFIYSERISLEFFGVVFFLAGLTLFYGLFRRRRLWVGRGLMAIYLCFLFSAALGMVAYGLRPHNWISNFIASMLIGLLYLRWRFKTAYINPEQFRHKL